LAKRFKDASLFLGRNANACVLNTEVKVYESPCKSEVLLRTQAVCRESLFFDRLKTELGNESLQACFTLITRVSVAPTCSRGWAGVKKLKPNSEPVCGSW
jgi:hypothetical protein